MYKSFTITKISSNTAKSNVILLTLVNASATKPEFTAISAIARIALISPNNSALSVSLDKNSTASNLSAIASTTLPKLFSIVSNSINFSTRLIPAAITSTKSASTLIPFTAFNKSPTLYSFLPVKALRTSSISGNAAIITANSLSNETFSYALF